MGGIPFAALVLEPSGQRLADLVGGGFEFLFLPFLVRRVAGGGGLLAGDDTKASCPALPFVADSPGGSGGEFGWAGAGFSDREVR